MAFTHGSGSAFKLDDSGGTLRDLSTYVKSVEGLPGSRDLADSTTFGNTAHKFLPGLQAGTITIKGNYDSTAVSGPDVVLNGLLTATATATYEYGPEGSTTGDVKYSGECWLQEYNTSAPVEGIVEFTAVLQKDGVVTKGTFA